MKHVARILSLAALIAMISCERSAPTSPPPPTPTPTPTPIPAQPVQAAATNQEPVIVVQFDPGMAMDQSRPPPGIRLAVWEDGTVLAGDDPEQMMVGRVPPDLVANVLADLSKAGFFSHATQYWFPPDSQNICVTAHFGATTRTHGAMNWAQSDPAWWPEVGTAIARIIPQDIRPIADVATGGAFRGYVIEEWYTTPWARP